MYNAKNLLLVLVQALGVACGVLVIILAYADGLQRMDHDSKAPSGAQPGTCAYMSVEAAENTLPPTYYNEQ